MQLNLNESNKNYLTTEIENEYLPKKDELKNIFLMNETIFGNNFYIQLEDKYDNFKTRTIYLVNELIETGKLNNFLEIVREKYSLFADKINIPQLELIQILNANFEDNREILLSTYRSSMPNRILRIQDPEDATKLISQLRIGMPQQQTYSYIEKFVGYLLRKELGSLFITSLKQWVKKNIENYEGLEELLSQEENDRKQQNSFLIVAISSKGKSYIMKAWKMIDPYKNGKPYSNCYQLTIKKNQKKDEFTAEITIKGDLSNFSKELKKFIDQCENLKQIQIFLPDKLMYHAVDYHDLSLGEGDWKTKLGEQYEVIIRSLDRLQLSNKHALKQKWLNKGKIFQQRWEELAGSIFINSDDKADYETFDRRLNNDPELIAVYFTNVIEVKQLKDHILLSGIPLALWIREQLPDNNQDTIDNCIINILRTQQLKDLPVQVKIEKGKNTIISKHLCLLWDDPNLLPPQQNLTDTKL
jgi:hypothetical protein